MAEMSELLSALNAIDPSQLDYMEWEQVGAALHHSGADWTTWDSWSRRDYTRYHEGECERKWRTFHANRKDAVTASTIFKMAYAQGWEAPERAHSAYTWDSAVRIVSDESQAPRVKPVTASTVSVKDVGEDEVLDGEPDSWRDEISAYLRALFKDEEYVGFVTDEVKLQDNGKWQPTGAGLSCFTSGEIIKRLHKKSNKDLGYILGDYPKEGGAFVRINPLDGEGASDANVTSYRFALVESDSLTQGKQLALIREMKLPVAAVVTSGHKSVHAIVHIDAANKQEYRERVQALYDYCKASGFVCDEQNRNPSRLSRLPGCQRGEHWQRLVPITWEKFDSWDSWQTWVTEQATGLPEIETVSNITELPELAPQLICGVMREGQKGMLIGPSKAGKSFALIELAIAVCKGWSWLGHKCKQGKVLYVNLEIQAPSFTHRLDAVYSEMRRVRGLAPEPLSGLADLDVWNLRGHASPLDRLVPMLVRKAVDRHYTLIIIDPIYKVLTGDENSASDMAAFTNQFDVICQELGCAVFYAHHHAKGKAGERAAVDRASGSGVFARDPDAMVDMSPLHIPKDKRDSVLSYEVIGDDGELHERHAGAYRLNYTLREFETPLPKDCLFKYPLHEIVDLSDYDVQGEPTQENITKRAAERRSSRAEEKWLDLNIVIGDGVNACLDLGMKPTVKNVWTWLKMNQAETCKAANMDEKKFGLWTQPGWRKAHAPLCEWEKRPDETGAYILSSVLN